MHADIVTAAGSNTSGQHDDVYLFDDDVDVRCWCRSASRFVTCTTFPTRTDLTLGAPDEVVADDLDADDDDAFDDGAAGVAN